MESKALVKSTNSNVAGRFFARTPSRILRIVNICEVVDRVCVCVCVLCCEQMTYAYFTNKFNKTNLKDSGAVEYTDFFSA